jgi:hypothetical protein
METWMMIAIGTAAVAAILVIASVVIGAKGRRRTKQTTRLREGFGPEYTKAVGEQGRSGAEEDLMKREKSAGQLHVRALSAIEVSRYNESWTATQAQFIDEPGAALTAADRLLVEVIAARGYPVSQFEEGASAISVDHPRAVQDYRAAHEVAQRNQRNAVSTDALRAAMVQYRSVFNELMDGAVGAPPVQVG